MKEIWIFYISRFIFLAKTISRNTL
jgi:hypothetical protein